MEALILAIAMGATAPWVGVVRAPDRHASIRPESRLWITGASNLRRFTCRASGLSGDVELRASATRRAVLSGENVSNAPSLDVPVARLDCGIAGMNEHLRDALRGSVYPTIEFRLDSYDVEVTGTAPRARIAGRLTIGGAERAVTATAEAHADTLGMLHIRGVYTIRMTAFGIEPPRRFAGLLRVRDRVAVHFDIVPGWENEENDVAHRPVRPTVPHIIPGATYASPN